MNKLFTKITSLALGAAMMIGVGVAVNSKNVSAAVATDYETTFTTTNSGGFSGGSKTTDGVTCTFPSGASWQSGHVRLYAGTSITFTSSSSTMTSIVISLTGTYANTWTASDSSTIATSDSPKTATWSGSASSITLTNSSSAQQRPTSIKVYHSSSGHTALTSISLSGDGVSNPSTNNYALSIASADTADHSIDVSLSPALATDQVVNIAHYSGTSGLFTVSSSATCDSGSGSFTVKGKGNSSGTETFKISGNTETSVAAYFAITATASRTVSFNSNGGSSSPSDIVIANGGTFTFPSAGTKSGHTFAGWSSDGGTTKYSVGATSPAVIADISYTGYWNEATIYTLVSDPSTLTDGTTFVLVGYASSTYRIGKGLNSGHVKMNNVTASTTISNGTSSGSTLTSTEADVFTLKESSGSWEILDSSGNYLQFTGGSNGNDSFAASSSANTKFTISGDESIDIISNAQSDRYWRYNTSTGDLRNGNSTYGSNIYMFANIASSTDTTTSLTISACSDVHYNSDNSTWTGYDSYTLDVSSFTISCTTTKTTPSEGYSFLGIGYMDGQTFVARDTSFSSGHPTEADTRLCWKANYPETAGGSSYLYAYVTLDVTADVVDSLEITGSMTNTTYNVGDSWDPSGFTVYAYYKSDLTKAVDVTSSANWEYSPANPAISTKSVVCTASFGGKTVDSESQSVIVAKANPIQQLYSKTSGSSVDVYGYYVGFLDGTGPVIMDGEYGIVIFNKTADVSEYTINETILHVTGEISIYKGLFEIGSSSISVASGSFEQPSDPVIHTTTGNETAEYASRLTTVTGTPSITGTFPETAGSADITLSFSVGSKTVQVFYKKAAQSADADAFSAIKTAVANSEEITIKGFTGWYNGFQVQMNGVVAAADSYTAEEFAAYLLEQTDAVCTGWKEGDNNHDALVTVWNKLIDPNDVNQKSYPFLPADQKTILGEANADEEGTTIEQAIARYEFLCGKYGLSQFIEGRDPIPTSGRIINILPSVEGNATVPVIIISVIGVSALGGFFFLRKRKEN